MRKHHTNLLKITHKGPDGHYQDVFFRPLGITERLEQDDIWFDHQVKDWKATNRIGVLVGPLTLEILRYHRQVEA